MQTYYRQKFTSIKRWNVLNSKLFHGKPKKNILSYFFFFQIFEFKSSNSWDFSLEKYPPQKKFHANPISFCDKHQASINNIKLHMKNTHIFLNISDEVIMPKNNASVYAFPVST